MAKQNEKPPWERSPLEIKVIDGYECLIMAEKAECYLIEFHDAKMEIVEAGLLKENIRWELPYPLKEGAPFKLVIYKDKGEIKIGAWPISKYWDKELLESCQD